MKVRNILLLMLAAAVFLASGCSTVTSAKIINQEMYQANDHYVVIHNPESNRNGADSEIVSALADYGISAKIQDKKDAVASNAPIIVTYEDWYKWDMAQYLWTLDIYLNDFDLRPFAHANFHHGGLHTFPDRRKMVSRLIDQMMLELGVPKK